MTENKVTPLDYLKYILPFLIAIGVLVAYVYFVMFLLDEIKAENNDWARMMILFSSVEAIVFAAAGFLFGQQINKKRAEKAEEAEKEAKDEKKEIKEEKKAVEMEKKISKAEERKAKEEVLDIRNKGYELKKDIEALNKIQGALGAQNLTSGNRGSEMQELAEKAKRYFPDMK